MGTVAALTLNHIGDVLFSEPALRALKAGYPQERLVVVVHPAAKAVLEGNPAIDELWPRPLGRGEVVKMARWLRRVKPQVCVSFSPSSTALALAAFLSGCPRRFGFAFRSGVRCFFTSALPFDTTNHLAGDFLALAEAAGGKAEDYQPRVFLQDAEREWAEKKLRQLDLENAPWLLGVHPSSSVPRKCWPPERFVHLMRRARREWGAVPLVFGSPEERERCARLAEEGGGLNLAGELSLRQFMAVMERCGAFVGGDSGPLHIAAALGVLTLGLYGPTDPRRVGPLGRRVGVVRGETLAQVQVPQVWEFLLGMLGRQG
ncbi:MAG TPA: glycosyltransferase family 9 protein [Armatimonadetes bacterium]|nr:glycosyltransferase family 9 protein [Armatimonadota bacterium]